MTLTEAINIFGAVATIGMGLMGFLTPNVASKFTGLTATNKTAFAEFRATFGGAFVVMGAIPLLTGDPSNYFLVGMIWVGAAFGRLISVIFDKGYTEPKNLFGIVFEGAFGALLLVGSPLEKLGF